MRVCHCDDSSVCCCLCLGLGLRSVLCVESCSGLPLLFKPVSTSHHNGTDTDSAVLIVLAKQIKLTPQHSDNNNKSKSKIIISLPTYSVHDISGFVVMSFIMSQ